MDVLELLVCSSSSLFVTSACQSKPVEYLDLCCGIPRALTSVRESAYI